MTVIDPKLQAALKEMRDISAMVTAQRDAERMAGLTQEEYDQELAAAAVGGLDALSAFMARDPHRACIAIQRIIWERDHYRQYALGR